MSFAKIATCKLISIHGICGDILRLVGSKRKNLLFFSFNKL